MLQNRYDSGGQRAIGVAESGESRFDVGAGAGAGSGTRSRTFDFDFGNFQRAAKKQWHNDRADIEWLIVERNYGIFVVRWNLHEEKHQARRGDWRCGGRRNRCDNQWRQGKRRRGWRRCRCCCWRSHREQRRHSEKEEKVNAAHRAAPRYSPLNLSLA